MKKLLSFIIVASAFLSASADILIYLPKDFKEENIEMTSGFIQNIAGKKRGETVTTTELVPVKDGKCVIKNLTEGDAQYTFSFGEQRNLTVYAGPQENIVLTITQLNPLQYKVEGSELMSGVLEMDNQAQEILNEFRAEQSKPDVDTSKLQALEDSFYNIFSDYISHHPGSPAVGYALLNMEGEEFLLAYNSMTPEAKSSLLMPYVETQKKYVEKRIEAERKMKLLQSGNVAAPDFTFKNREGKEVSLHDFNGKWVIIDFWGSWCRWCIKGIPALKEAYAKYKPELEVVGVACNDSYEAWEKALDKYELDWVNLYNPTEGGGPILQEYGVEGFPTKVIVNPEGKIARIVSGDDPAFYDMLRGFIGK